jgi:endo-1,4-beta-xylanase
MKQPSHSLRSIGILTLCCAAVTAAACAAEVTPDDLGNGGTSMTGVAGSGAGASASGTGSIAGFTAGGGQPPGTSGTSGIAGSGSAGGGNTSQGGHSGGPGTGGHAGSGSTSGSGGAGSSGSFGGGGASGGKAGSGSGGSAGSTTVDDACAVTTAPTGGTPHASNNASGTAAGLSWTIWSNGNGGSITTYTVPAFSANWNNSGDFLARIGLQWNASKTYDEYGTLSAQFNYKKTGTGGGYSYIGIYGWSVSPCVEFYIVEDSYNNMPVNPGNTTNNKVSDEIDGSKYNLLTRSTTGTGGSKCSGVNSWNQYYSVRQKGRQCGTISITKHFDAWKANSMPLGKMDQAQILVEVGGGSGSVDFSVANVTATP